MEPTRGNLLYDDILPRVSKISLLLAILGLSFKFLLLQWGSVLLVIGLSTLTAVYYLRAFAPISPSIDENSSINYEQVSPSQTNFLVDAVGPVVQGIATAVILIGTLFKLLFWAGAMQILLAGTLCLAIVLATQLHANKLSRKALLFTALGSSTVLIPTDDIVQQFYRDNPYLVEKMIFQHHHPHDRTAKAEVLRLLHARHNR